MSRSIRLIFVLFAVTLNLGQDFSQRHAFGLDVQHCIPNKLLNNVTPLEYDLELGVDPELGLLHGNVDIFVSVNLLDRQEKCSSRSRRPIDCSCRQQETIVLNMDASTKIKKSRFVVGDSVHKLRQGRGKSLKVEAVDWNPKTNLVALQISPGFNQSSFGLISIEFAHQTRAKLLTNTTVFGKFLLAKPLNLFPCFDVPRFKSRFSLTIETNEQLSVYSNMPLAGERQMMNNKRRISFKQSPEIPVHKLVFSVGDYKTEKANEQPVGIPELRLVSESRELHKAGQFALEVAAKALKWLTEKLGRPLPIEKLDVIACRGVNFNSSSHLGAILIEENFLLVDPKESSPERKILVALNVAQSVAQQWFGNLLSPSRWFDNWLTLGSSGLLALDLLDELYPGLGARHYVRSHLLPREMRLGAARVMRQSCIQISLPKPSQAEESSSRDLEWVRGASIMSMVQSLVGGPEQLLAALRLLVSYDSTGLITQDKLTDCLSKVSQSKTQTQLDTFLNRWNEHISYPLLSVQIDPNSETSSIVIYQSNIEHVKSLDLDRIRMSSFQDAVHVQLKVMFSNLDGSRREFVELPLNAFSGRPTPLKPMPGLVRVSPPDWFNLSSSTSSDWLKLVIEPTVLPYYRVRYAQDLVERMRLPIKSGLMTDMGEIDLLNDASSLIQMNDNVLPRGLMTNIISWFSLDNSNQQHRSSAVLNELLQAKQSQLDMISSVELIGGLDKALRNLPLCRRVFEEFGFSQASPDESVFEQFVRSLALIDLINDENQQVVKAALKVADEPAEAFLRAPIYVAISRAGSEEQRASLIERLNGTNWPEETERLRLATQNILAPNNAKSLNLWSRFFRSRTGGTK